MIRSIKLALICGLLGGCAHSGENSPPPIERELATLLAILPGTYAGEAPKGMTPGGEMQMLTHSFTTVVAPQFSEQVLYYQVTRGTAEGPILQAKIFVFATETQRQANTMHALVLTPEQAETLRRGTPADWRRLSPSGLMSFPATCFFTWTRHADGFVGEGSDRCSYASKAFGQIITPDMRYRITSDAFEMEETLIGEDGAVIVTTGGALTAARQ